MIDINKIMPTIPGMKWGALTNYYPSNNKIRQLHKLLPHDSKWHLVLKEKGGINIDGIPVEEKKAEDLR